MDIRPIRNESDHTEALKEIERLWEAEAGTPDGDKLEALATLVEAYEEKRWPIDEPSDGLVYLRSVMELSGRTQKDLADLFNSRSHASEVLGRKRELSLSQIRLLVSEWKLTADILVKPYRLLRKQTRKGKLSARVAARKAARRAAAKKVTKRRVA